MSSSVDGWIVSPRKSRKKSACFSSTATSTPARASKKPSIMPAGPPPAIATLTFKRYLRQHAEDIRDGSTEPLRIAARDARYRPRATDESFVLRDRRRAFRMHDSRID